jgi:probable rRNA maturation factor
METRRQGDKETRRRRDKRIATDADSRLPISLSPCLPVFRCTISISNRQKLLPVDRRRIRGAIRAILKDAGCRRGEVSVAVVDDTAIARLHQEFLDDPTPTDVLSFLLERSEELLEGEVVVSAETASANAPRYRCTPSDELLRYIVHGALHLVGHDDRTPRQRAAMRRREDAYLRP